MVAIVPGETAIRKQLPTLCPVVKQWRDETQPRAEFRRRRSARPDHRRRPALSRRTTAAGAEVPDIDDDSHPGADPCRTRLRHVAQRIDLVADRGGLDS